VRAADRQTIRRTPDVLLLGACKLMRLAKMTRSRRTPTAARSERRSRRLKPRPVAPGPSACFPQSPALLTLRPCPRNSSLIHPNSSSCYELSAGFSAAISGVTASASFKELSLRFRHPYLITQKEILIARRAVGLDPDLLQCHTPEWRGSAAHPRVRPLGLGHLLLRRATPMPTRREPCTACCVAARARGSGCCRGSADPGNLAARLIARSAQWLGLRVTHVVFIASSAMRAEALRPDLDRPSLRGMPDPAISVDPVPASSPG